MDYKDNRLRTARNSDLMHKDKYFSLFFSSFLPFLLTPNIKWVSHPSLAKPAISTSERLLISEVPSEAR